jgi:Helix-turn-helix domain
MQTTVNRAREQAQSSKGTITPILRISQFAAVTHTIIHRSKAPLKEKGFLSVLATWANQDGICYPSDEKIAARAGVSVRTVQRLKAKCKKLRELDVLVNASPLKTDLLRICCVGGQTLEQYQAYRKTQQAALSVEDNPKPATISPATGDKPKPKLSPEVKDLSRFKSSPDSSDSHSQRSYESGVKERISTPEQTSAAQVTALSPPGAHIVLKPGDTPTQEDRQRWAEILAGIVPAEAMRREADLNKAQRRALLSRMNGGILPWPRNDTRKGRWLNAQLRRSR